MNDNLQIDAVVKSQSLCQKALEEMHDNPETEAYWLRGLLPKHRNPVPDPPAWGDWNGSCWTTAIRGPKLIANNLVTMDPVLRRMAFVDGSGTSNDMRINRVGWGLTLQLRDERWKRPGQARMWCPNAL
eukprot:2029493-Pyramimonas_sp.AAC.1